jgi:hypothetical protein
MTKCSINSILYEGVTDISADKSWSHSGRVLKITLVEVKVEINEA